MELIGSIQLTAMSFSTNFLRFALRCAITQLRQLVIRATHVSSNWRRQHMMRAPKINVSLVTTWSVSCHLLSRRCRKEMT